MATRFLLETKGISRVKGVTFHPVFPWICASTYIGVIHVWDYETNREIHRFRHPCYSKINDNKHYDQEEPLLEPNVTRGNDDGNGDIETGLPVRCVDFHPQDPLIISAGDDLNIKLWDCHIRQCLRTFSGHTDYIRTVRFHPKAHITSPHHLPWILSASDDRTLRIWNYLTRTCLCVVHDGHTDYIMSAQFHPTLDFILTASLDHTLRVWDTKHLVTTQTTNTQTSTPTTTTTPPPTATTAQTQHFNKSHYSALTKSESSSLSTPIKLKFVLQGHQHGVNWAVFHPSLPFIASASDDCQVKIWKFTDDQAWEEKIQLTRHDLNVTCCMFANNTTMDTTSSSTPIIVSCSEDGRVCVWDGNDQTCIGAFRRNSRFWVLASHPTNNIMAAGHDSGFIIFKVRYLLKPLFFAALFPFNFFNFYFSLINGFILFIFLALPRLAYRIHLSKFNHSWNMETTYKEAKDLNTTLKFRRILL